MTECEGLQFLEQRLGHRWSAFAEDQQEAVRCIDKVIAAEDKNVDEYVQQAQATQKMGSQRSRRSEKRVSIFIGATLSFSSRRLIDSDIFAIFVGAWT